MTKMIRLVLNELDPIKELEFERRKGERSKISTAQPYLIKSVQTFPDDV